jgi:hypothetical protein
MLIIGLLNVANVEYHIFDIMNHVVILNVIMARVVALNKDYFITIFIRG